MTKKIFGNVILATAVGLTSAAFAATIDLSTVTANMTFANGDVITGTLGANVKLSIADNALVTLRPSRARAIPTTATNGLGLRVSAKRRYALTAPTTSRASTRNIPASTFP